MEEENKNWKVKAIIAGLLVLGTISIVYSYSKPLIASNKSVVVSDNKSKANNSDEDKPLQVVKSEKTDGIEGFNRMMGLIGENEAVVKIGMSRKDIEERLKKLNKNNKADEIKFLNDIKGENYKLNLSTLEKSPFNFEDWSIISPDKTKYLYGIKENGEQSCYIVDIKSNTKKKINMKENVIVANWAKNSKYIVGSSYGESPSIVVYDIQNDKMKEFKDDSKEINSLADVYSSNGKDVYFIATTIEKKNDKAVVTEGVYKVNTDDGKMEPIMILPPAEEGKFKNRVVGQGVAVINEGEKVVFQGDFNGEDGLFIYDVKSKKTNKVAQSTGIGLVPFWVSPDENKLVYGTYSGEANTGVWSISTAKLKENDLVNKILLLDVDYHSLTGANNVWWNNDSNKVTIFESKKFIVDNEAFVEKGIIHSIYFK